VLRSVLCRLTGEALERPSQISAKQPIHQADAWAESDPIGRLRRIGHLERNVTVNNSVFSNTRGTRPSAGIVIEPDWRRRVDGVTITHSGLFGNEGPGIKVHNKRGPVENVKISDCQFAGKEYPIKSQTFSWISRKLIGLRLFEVTEAEIAGQG